MEQFGQHQERMTHYVFCNERAVFWPREFYKTTSAPSNIKRYLFCEPDKFPIRSSLTF